MNLMIISKYFDYFKNNIVNIEKICWKINKIEILSENLNKEKLLNFVNDKNQLFSIVKNYKLYELLQKSLSKQTILCSRN